jgi:hypothetical protein
MSEMDFEELRCTLAEQGAIVDFDNVLEQGEPVEFSEYPVSRV